MLVRWMQILSVMHRSRIGHTYIVCMVYAPGLQVPYSAPQWVWVIIHCSCLVGGYLSGCTVFPARCGWYAAGPPEFLPFAFGVNENDLLLWSKSTDQTSQHRGVAKLSTHPNRNFQKWEELEGSRTKRPLDFGSEFGCFHSLVGALHWPSDIQRLHSKPCPRILDWHWIAASYWIWFVGLCLPQICF